MATKSGKIRCIICSKEKATMRCAGCFEEYCYNHMGDHRQQLNKQLDEIEINRDLVRQSLTQHIEQPNNQTLIKQIDEWEQKSIKTIQQTAEESRQIVLKNTTEYHHQLEIKLNNLTNELRESRQENDFNEINLRQFQEELDKLTAELIKPSNISLREDTRSFINKISVNILSATSTSDSFIPKWIQNGIIVVGGNGSGKALNQLNLPIGIYVDDDRTIYVADCGNHRIVEWKYGATNGRVVAGGNGPGDNANQLYNPKDVVVDKERNYIIICDRQNRRVVRWLLRNGTSGQTIISNIDCSRLTMDNNGYLYVSDYKKQEVRRWKVGDTSGVLVAGGNGKGIRLNQLSEPTFLFVDDNQTIYVSDWGNHRVMKWMKDAKEGIIVAGGQGQGNSLKQLSEPTDLIVDHLGSLYVADYKNNRIMRWCKGATEGNIVVDGNGKVKRADQLNTPIGLSFDRQGNLYVVEVDNNRVQRFDLDQN